MIEQSWQVYATTLLTFPGLVTFIFSVSFTITLFIHIYTHTYMHIMYASINAHSYTCMYAIHTCLCRYVLCMCNCAYIHVWYIVQNLWEACKYMYLQSASCNNVVRHCEAIFAYA